MSWVRLDDQMPHHPKILALSGNAFRLHTFALCYSSSQLTDGHIPRTAMPLLRGTKRHAQELVQAGLWTENGTGWDIHDYLDYQPSRRETLETRERAKERMAKQRRMSGKFARTDDEQSENFNRSSRKVPPPRPDPSTTAHSGGTSGSARAPETARTPPITIDEALAIAERDGF